MKQAAKPSCWVGVSGGGTRGRRGGGGPPRGTAHTGRRAGRRVCPGELAAAAGSTVSAPFKNSWLDGFLRRRTLRFKPGGDGREVLSEALLEFLSKLSRFREKLVILANCGFPLRRDAIFARDGLVPCFGREVPAARAARPLQAGELPRSHPSSASGKRNIHVSFPKPYNRFCQ